MRGQRRASRRSATLTVHRARFRESPIWQASAPLDLRRSPTVNIAFPPIQSSPSATVTFTRPSRTALAP